MKKIARISVLVSTPLLLIFIIGIVAVFGRFAFSWIPLRTTMLIINDDTGRARMTITAKPDDAPRVLLLDQSGTARAELGLTPVGDPSLTLMSSQGKSRLRVSLLGRGAQPEISLFDSNGRVRWSVRLADDGTPEITEVK